MYYFPLAALITALSCISRTKCVKIALDDEELSQNYLKFFNLVSKKATDTANMHETDQLKKSLTAACFHKQIVDLFERGITPKKQKNLNAKLEKFNKLLLEIDEFSYLNNCKLWGFWRQLIQFFDQPKLAKNQIVVSVSIENCKMIEKCFTEDPVTVAEDSEYCALYRTHEQEAHFKMLLHLLGSEFEIDFLQFFTKQKIAHEKKFALAQRRLRKEQMNSSKNMKSNKTTIEQELVGPEKMRQLELMRPFYMAIDIVDVEQEAVDYVNLLSQDDHLRHRSENWLSVRTYATWTMNLFIKIHQLIGHNPQMGDVFEEPLEHIKIAWRRGIIGTDANANEFWQQTNLDEAMAPLRWRWLRLTILYKQIENLMPADQQQRWLFPVVIVMDDVRNASDQLVEEHTKNMIRLSKKKNVFSDFLRNSLNDENDVKKKLELYFNSKFNHNAELYESFLESLPKNGPIKMRDVEGDSFNANSKKETDDKNEIKTNGKKKEKLNEKNIKLASPPNSALSFNAFCDDQFLYEKYAEFLLDPSDDKIALLDIGAYVNEIEQRIGMWEQLQRLMMNTDDGILSSTNGNSDQMNLIKSEWKMLMKSTPTSNEEMHEFEQNLYQMLFKILPFADDTKVEKEISKISIKKWNAQLHMKKFSLALFEQTKNGAIWATTGDKDRDRACRKLFGIRFKRLLYHYFVLPSLEKMSAQINFELETFNEMVPENQQNLYLHPTFPRMSQQLHNVLLKPTFFNNENYLNEFAIENTEEHELKIKNGLIKLHTIVSKWSFGKAQLLISGSYFLNAHSTDSDIDLLCIVPEPSIKLEYFFGNDNAKCVTNVCSLYESKASLYCLLCSDISITNLLKITYGTVYLITFKLDGISFDLAFASIPNVENLPFSINEKIFKKFIQLSNSDDEAHQKMIRALSSHRALHFIAYALLQSQTNGNWQNILNGLNKNLPKTIFQIMLKAIKMWAKNHYVYSNKYGYLNGAMLTIMVTKIVLLYPNASLPFLIEKFFLIYSMRSIFVPVKLAPTRSFIANAKTILFLGTSDEQEMPVHTPAFPEQNAGRLVTHNNAKIIHAEMIGALQKIRSDGLQNFNLHNFLHQTVEFVDKYQHFVLINCVAEQHTTISDKFCLFVDGRIRRQIVYDLDPKSGPTIGTHLYPDVYRHNCEMSNKFLTLAFRPSYCMVWLVGIASKVNNAQLSPLLAQFDSRIRRDFLRYNPIIMKNATTEKFGGKSQNNHVKGVAQLDEEEINANFANNKLMLKSIFVNKWEIMN